MARRVSLSVLILALAAFSQGDRGTVTGLVIDRSGAAVAGVKISLVNNDTQLTLETASNEAGNYRFVSVPIGRYTMRAAAAGFQGYQREDVQVQVSQTTPIDVPLEVGAVTETVTVTGAVAPLIQTETADVGMVVQAKQFLDLPLTLGGGIRNPSSFIRLSPGVSPRSTWNKSISGGGSFQDMVYYDGIALSRGDLSNDGEVNPSVEAIAEFKLIANNYSAEYAHALGGITSFTMRSGTNEVHGTGFHFLRNDKLDARGFFSPERSQSQQNEWGGTIGGPVVIPKLYDGRNKTFWFFSFDQFYIRGGQRSTLNTLPTARMQEGDFSELGRAIFDPSTTRQLPNGTLARDPFAGGIIPRSRWSQVSTSMLQFHPKPELPGVTANSVSPLLAPWQDHRHAGGKFDHLFNSNHRLSATFNVTDRPALKSRGGEGGGHIVPVNDPSQTALVGYVAQRVTTRVLHANFDSNISPTTINHIGLGFSRFRNPFKTPSADEGWTQPNGGKLGLRGLQFDQFPLVRFESEGYAWYGARSATDNFFNTYTALDTLTMIRGSHTIKVGAEMQYHQDNYRSSNAGGGAFRFIRNTTGNPQDLARTGDSWASFLLGEVQMGEGFFRATEPSGRYTNWGFYFDDSWKVTPRLTLNFGLRWEVITPHADRAGRLSYIDLSKPNQEAGGLPGVLVFGGEKGFGTRLLNNLWVNPGPRFGLAYRIADNTVIRGGAGIFYSNYINQGLGLPATGFSTLATFVSGDGGLTPAFNWDGGFPQNFQRPPNFSPFQANGLNGTAVLPSDYSLPSKFHWSLTLERQFADDLAISASYVANKGTHLYETQQINQLGAAAQQLPLTLLRANIASPQAAAAGIPEPFPGFTTLWGGRATVAQALRPYPQYADVSIYGSTYGNSHYESFQLKVDKRYKGGLSGTFAYTWSKFLSDGRQFDSFAGGQDAYKRENSYHATDLPHMLTFSLLYRLPFGAGQRWLSGARGPARVMTEGWQLAAVASYSSGDRISVSTNNTLPYFNPGLRPDQISGNVRSNVSLGAFDPAIHQYLNREAFEAPAAGQFGTAPRYLEVRGPARPDESFAVLKDTRINERFTHQFRMEIANPLNRVVFGNPVTNLAAGNFGRITSAAVGPRNIQFGMKLMF